MMALLTDSERKLLERLAAEGKRTRLTLSELEAAKSLEADGFVFLTGAYAVITPKGRRLLAGEEQSKKVSKKPPSSLLE